MYKWALHFINIYGKATFYGYEFDERPSSLTSLTWIVRFMVTWLIAVWMNVFEILFKYSFWLYVGDDTLRYSSSTQGQLQCCLLRFEKAIDTALSMCSLGSAVCCALKAQLCQCTLGAWCIAWSQAIFISAIEGLCWQWLHWGPIHQQCLTVSQLSACISYKSHQLNGDRTQTPQKRVGCRGARHYLVSV